MKKLLSLLLICCCALTYADDTPVFEETDECQIEIPSVHGLFTEKSDGESHHPFDACYVSWKKYKANFGIEKLFIRFPTAPSITQSSTLLTAYAYDYALLYSLTGYYPPIGSIDPIIWFDQALDIYSRYPFVLISHVIFQASNGDWVMDYVAHDYIQNMIVKARAIVTPFNAYTLLCMKPNGSRDYFDYFLENFWIKCDCY